MEFKEALSYINLGNSVLFVGSGFSIGAENISGTPLPTGDGLAKLLYEECGESSDGGNLLDASELYIDKFGALAIVEYLKKMFTIKEITSEQKLITSLPWKRVYTTNYDNIIELGYNLSGRKIYPKVLTDSCRELTDKSKLCVHLNGYIERLDDSSLDSEFKLTDRSYTATDFVDSEWIALFDSDLKTADAIFFIGFSMNSDLDIKRVVFSDPELFQKCFFVVWDQEKKPVVRVLENYGAVLPINVKGFVDEYKTVTPKTVRLTTNYRCFNLVKDICEPAEIIDKDVHNLLTLGTVGNEKLATSLTYPDKKYYIDRTAIYDVYDKIEKGATRLLIHSDIANGKTLALMGIEILLTRKKYKVYKYNGNTYDVDLEVERICKDNATNVVFVVDNYSNNRKVLESIRLFGQNSIVLLSERSVVNEIATEWLFPKLGDFVEIDINVLSAEDISKFRILLDDFGFWSNKAALNNYEKEQYISHDCKARMRNVLMDLLNSKTVFERFQSIINVIQNKQGYYEALLLMLIGKVFNLELDLEKVSTVLGRDKINSSSFRRNSTIAEFVNFDQGRIIVRSSLLAEVILSKLSNTTTVVDLLILVFREYDKFRHHDSYRQILITLLSFTNLQRILNKKDVKYNDNIYRFFENVKTLNFCKENPHFWLQYAILVLSSRDYSRADKYFETAYAHARKKREFETFPIDNHYARYILENELESGTPETCMEAFLKAHSILIDPIHKTKVRFYPYRVAQNYYPFYEKFFNTMSPTEKKKFIKCCDDIKERAIAYAATAESSISKADVKKAIKLLEQIHNEVTNN
ncbi:MAG: SIR2 family protein [Bacteroidales bacterium]|nr:SIR2 family protein [Bacteroidales bacterium]